MKAAQDRGRRYVGVAVLLGGLCAGGSVADGQSETDGLARAGLPSRGPRALAVAGEAALVGTERGLYRWSEREARWVALLSGAPVDDLAVLGREVLIAAEGELYRWTPELETPRRAALPPGVEVRSVAADGRGRGWAAGAAGLFTCPGEGEEFEPVAAAPPAPLAVRAAGNRVWVSSGRALWVEQTDGSFTREVAGLTDGWWELRAAVEAAGTVWLAVPEGLWRIDASGPERRPLGSAVVGAVALPEGLAVVAEDALYCLRAGLSGSMPPSAASLTGAVAAAGGPAGVGVLDAGGVRWLACPAGADARLSAGAALALPPAAQVIALQRAMLAHQDLEAGRLRSVESRALRRARLPEVALSFSGDMARAREHGRDQNVTTGRVNDLVDASRARDGGGEVRLQLSWELWRAAEPDALLAISRERRELIELREQILERFNRAYFELWRTRARLAAAPAASSERSELEVRARELAAVLDAWTGGAFSRLESDPRASP